MGKAKVYKSLLCWNRFLFSVVMEDDENTGRCT